VLGAGVTVAVVGSPVRTSALGLRAHQVFEVLEVDTAVAVGSGSVAVLATPRLLGWCEAVTLAALEPALRPGWTSVGVRVELDHLAPSAVGARVTVEAVVTAADDRRVEFDLTATDSGGTVVGRSRITRVVVEVERFMNRVGFHS